MKWALLPVMLVVFAGSLVHVDRIFFKRSHSFCVHFLYHGELVNAEYDLPRPSAEEEQMLDKILSQPFYYLAKGGHAYAFLSEDGQYVIKFHRYPSHMRLCSWASHPFSYRFSERRQKIKDYNSRKVGATLLSYKNSYIDLKEESGLLLAQINPMDCMRRAVTLIDATGARYRVPLNRVSFLLQRKAELIYPTLETLMRAGRVEEARCVVAHVIQLIATTYQKGYIDHDPVLKRNYGLVQGRAIHIDLGDLVKEGEATPQGELASHVRAMTQSLHAHLKRDYPELASYYAELIETLELEAG